MNLKQCYLIGSYLPFEQVVLWADNSDLTFIWLRFLQSHYSSGFLFQNIDCMTCYYKLHIFQSADDLLWKMSAEDPCEIENN